MSWGHISSAPEGVPIWTIISDHRGLRIVQYAQ